MVAPKVSVENLSLGGAFLRTPTPMPVGAALEIELALPGLLKRLRLTGKVVSAVSAEDAKARTAVPGMGVCFDPPTGEDLARLRALLLAVAPSPAALQGDAVPEAVQAPALVDPEPVAAELPTPEPAMAEAAPPAVATVPDSAKLMVQVRGLILEMSDWQSRAQVLERENDLLRAENEQLKAELARLKSRAG
jgi:hypothetical protein